MDKKMQHSNYESEYIKKFEDIIEEGNVYKPTDTNPIKMLHSQIPRTLEKLFKEC